MGLQIIGVCGSQFQFYSSSPAKLSEIKPLCLAFPHLSL
jgi:hypothetical protein